MLDNDTYITSDLHFFHKNIIKYCNRPYELSDDGIALMNEDILKKFDDLPEGCTIINNGDICLNSSISFDCLKVLIQRMKNNNKKLWLILGNHDRSIIYHNKGHGYTNPVDFFRGLGFDEVFEYPILVGNLLLSHYPIYIPPQSSFINVHGHTHQTLVDKDYFNRLDEDLAQKPKIKRDIDPKKYYNVCIDNTKDIIYFRDIVRYEVLSRK